VNNKLRIGLGIFLGILLLFPVIYLSVHQLHHHHEYFHCDASGSERHYHSEHDSCIICEYLSTFNYDFNVQHHTSPEIYFFGYILIAIDCFFVPLQFFDYQLRAPPFS